MKFDRYQVTITFTEMALGTASKQADIYKSWFQDKQRQAMEKAGIEPDEALQEELASMQFSEEKGLTGFHRDRDGVPILYDYMIRGFFKSAISALRRDPDEESPVGNDKALRAFKKVVDTQVFVKPRKIALVLSEDASQVLDIFERPLRASTPQGERVSIARSEYVPEGTTATFEVLVLGVLKEKHLREILEYGMFHGLCQWRSAGFGVFDHELSKVSA